MHFRRLRDVRLPRRGIADRAPIFKDSLVATGQWTQATTLRYRNAYKHRDVKRASDCAVFACRVQALLLMFRDSLFLRLLALLRVSECGDGLSDAAILGKQLTRRHIPGDFRFGGRGTK
jgi:hypothetical protein